MIKKLKEIYLEVRNKEPGRRFRDFYDERHSHAKGSKWKKIAYPILGFLLVIIGILLSIPPGVPGFVVVLIGLAIIAMKSHLFALFLDYGELRIRRLLKL